MNNLIGNKNRNVPGWTLSSLTNGPWNVRSGGDYNHCSKGETWFGWASGQLTGSITTKLKGCGKALLDVGKFGYSRGGVKLEFVRNSFNSTRKFTIRLIRR